MAPTRSAAQRLIETGGVRWLGPKGWAVPKKAGEDLPDDAQLEVTDDGELRYVSRGGLKLEGALDRTKVDVTGMVCLDVGMSTGGFTDVLLQRGAARVVGLDVGKGQLHPRLAADARVLSFEGVNARHVEAASLPQPNFDLVVGDLSFISSALVLPAIAPLVKPVNGSMLWLAKPQFELQPVDIGKNGIVKNESAYARVEARLREACAANGLAVIDWFESAINGGDGNREFFMHAVPASSNQNKT